MQLPLSIWISKCNESVYKVINECVPTDAPNRVISLALPDLTSRYHQHTINVSQREYVRDMAISGFNGRVF